MNKSTCHALIHALIDLFIHSFIINELNRLVVSPRAAEHPCVQLLIHVPAQ